MSNINSQPPILISPKMDTASETQKIHMSAPARVSCSRSTHLSATTGTTFNISKCISSRISHSSQLYFPPRKPSPLRPSPQHQATATGLSTSSKPGRRAGSTAKRPPRASISHLQELSAKMSTANMCSLGAAQAAKIRLVMIRRFLVK